jgi:tripartite-type tricarboxylate transporter receptor subunit TctC
VIGAIVSRRRFAALAAFAFVSGGLGDEARASGDFYKGKTITFVIGYSPGGGYDTYARLVARHLADHIPGRPTIVLQNMPGASSRVATAYVYKAAPRDGTVLVTADQSLPLEQALGEPLPFDMRRFNFIGNPSVDNNTTATWAASGVKTIEDAKKREVTVGATGGSPSSQYPIVMNAVLGTKFKVVLGYPGGADIDLAMERGEVEGRGSNSWASWKATKPEWLRDHKINILVQIGLAKASDLPQVPLLSDLATNARDRSLLRLLSEPVQIGRPVFTAPDAPPQRIAILRAAFNAMLRDPAFLADARKEHLDISGASGREVQQVISDIVSTPRSITGRLATILGSQKQ